MVTTAMTVLPCVPRGCSTHDHFGGRPSSALGRVPGVFLWVVPLLFRALEGAHRTGDRRVSRRGWGLAPATHGHPFTVANRDDRDRDRVARRDVPRCSGAGTRSQHPGLISH